MSKNHNLQNINRKVANDEKLSFAERNILNMFNKKQAQAGLTPEVIQTLSNKFTITYHRKS